MAQVRMIEEADDASIADWLEHRLKRPLALGPVAIAVPGGATPFPILAELASRQLAWSNLTVWPTDDRLVPQGHPASNIGRIARIVAPLGARCVALEEAARPPNFALVWLGMGSDGHIASLFPSADPSPNDPLPLRRLTPDPLPPEAPFDRMSLTIPALLNCDELLFVIRGEDKRRLFERAARGENDLPVSRLLAAANQPITCFA